MTIIHQKLEWEDIWYYSAMLVLTSARRHPSICARRAYNIHSEIKIPSFTNSNTCPCIRAHQFIFPPLLWNSNLQFSFITFTNNSHVDMLIWKVWTADPGLSKKLIMLQQVKCDFSGGKNNRLLSATDKMGEISLLMRPKRKIKKKVILNTKYSLALTSCALKSAFTHAPHGTVRQMYHS